MSLTSEKSVSPRVAGVVGAIGSAASAVTAIIVAAAVTPSSEVSPAMWSYPWSAAALVPVSILYAVLHAGILVGLLGLARVGPGRVGALIAAAGTAVLTLAELASIPIADQRMDDTGPGLVGTTFGLGTVASAIGLVVAGVAIVRARRWTGWRRYIVLAAGLWTAVMVGLVNTAFLAVAVGIYGLALTAVFAALATAPASPNALVEQPAGT